MPSATPSQVILGRPHQRRVVDIGAAAPPVTVWILATGFWNDLGVWDDTAFWID